MVIAVDDAATARAARSAAMMARTKATSQRGSDQSGQLRIATDCDSMRRAPRIGAFLISLATIWGAFGPFSRIFSAGERKT
jgi:hypothetical protein